MKKTKKFSSQPFEQRLSLFAGSRLVLRLDLNVPVAGGQVLDDFKLRIALPTLRLLRKSSPLVVITHLGQPPKNTPLSSVKYSTAPLARWLKQKMGGKIFSAEGNFSDLLRQAKDLQVGEIMVMPNVRLLAGETENDSKLAARLARLGEVYINDAFAVSHRAHASVEAIADYLPVYPGPRLLEECLNLNNVISPKKPLVVVLGGAKISTKLPLIKSLAPKAEKLLIGGGIANTEIYFKGYEIGGSLYDHSVTLRQTEVYDKVLSLPVDLTVLSGKVKSIKKVGFLNKHDVIVDIGPKTAENYRKIIANASTVFWNGPVGIFEKKYGQEGSRVIARAMVEASAKGCFTCIGGGETVAAARRLAAVSKVSWLSTGGGASVSYIAGVKMPGLKRLTI
ncbi:MAG: phosphoglycerate kinase [Patescibacteria group bacterium]|nr:MAG: phosphoglycerate kinase [Patescibacteria group bacterium]